MASESKVAQNHEASGYQSFLLGRAHLGEVANMRQACSNSFDIALELLSARLKTEEALKQGYVSLESLVQMADVCVQQLLNFYDSQQRMPDSKGLYEKIVHYFEEAVEIGDKEVRGTVSAKKSPVTVTPAVSYLVTVAEHLISGNLYKMFPPQYGQKFAGACAKIGGTLTMAGVNDKRLESLLSVSA